MIYFNSINQIAQISKANWCKLLGLSYEEFEILSIKNPPLDDQSKNILIAVDMMLKNGQLTAFINKCHKDFFVKKESDLVPIKSLADKYCVICDTPLLNGQRDYCSIKCKQKAYRERTKARRSLETVH